MKCPVEETQPRESQCDQHSHVSNEWVGGRGGGHFVYLLNKWTRIFCGRELDVCVRPEDERGPALI